MAIYSDSGFITGRDTPLIRPTLDLNFAKDKRLDSRVTFTRASSATYTDELGIVRTVPNNVPRFDHDPTTGESLGLLIEESRTNYHGNTGDDSNVGRYGNGPGSTSNTTSPTGENDATIPVPNADADRFEAYLGVNDTVAGEKWTFTWHEKNINYSGTEPVADPSNHVNLTNITSPTLIATYPNGWKRWSVTAEVQTTGTEARFRYYFGNRIGVGNNNIAAFWGHQSEKGSFATSYIRGNGVTVTRSADLASITGTNFSSWYNQSEGTILIEDICQNTSNDWTNSIAFRGDGNFNRILFFKNWAGVYNILEVYANNAQVVRLQYDAIVGERYKVCNAYKLNDFASSISGQIQTDSDATVPIIDRVEFGSDAVAVPANTTYVGHISRLIYYPKRLPNDQLQALTS